MTEAVRALQVSVRSAVSAFRTSLGAQRTRSGKEQGASPAKPRSGRGDVWSSGAAGSVRVTGSEGKKPIGKQDVPTEKVR